LTPHSSYVTEELIPGFYRLELGLLEVIPGTKATLSVLPTALQDSNGIDYQVVGLIYAVAGQPPSDDSPLFLHSSNPSSGLTSIWSGQLLSVESLEYGCADVENYVGDADFLCDDFAQFFIQSGGYPEWVSIRHQGLRQVLPGEGFEVSLAWFSGNANTACVPDGHPTPPPSCATRFFVTLILQDPYGTSEPYATPTPTLAPSCQTLTFVDQPAIADFGNYSIDHLNHPNNPANRLTEFAHPFDHGVVTLDWGAPYPSSLLTGGMASNLISPSQYAGRHVTFYNDPNSPLKFSFAAAVVALGAELPLEDIGYQIDYLVEPQDGAGGIKITRHAVWGYVPAEGHWYAWPLDGMPPQDGVYFKGVDEDGVKRYSHIYVGTFVRSANGIPAEFNVSPGIRVGGQTYYTGDSFCLSVTPTPTATLDPLGPTWTPTATRTALATFTRTPSPTPTEASLGAGTPGYCGQWAYLRTPSPAPVISSSTPTPSPTPNVTRTQISLHQTATAVGPGNATQLAGTVWAVATATVMHNTQAAQATGTATIAPYHTALAATQTQGPSATAQAYITSTWVASTPGNEVIATSAARATAYMGTAQALSTQASNPGNTSLTQCFGANCQSPQAGDGLGLGGNGLGLGFNLNLTVGQCYTLLPSGNLGAGVSWRRIQVCVRWVAFPYIEILAIRLPIELLLLPMAVGLLLRLWRL
jgi:hypothetical protein